MLTKPPFLFAARPINMPLDAAIQRIQPKSWFNEFSHSWGGRECTDPVIQWCRPWQEASRSRSRLTDGSGGCCPGNRCRCELCARPAVAAAAAARLLPREGGSCPAPASGEGGSCPAPAYVGAEPAGGRRGCRRFSIRENLLNFETLLLSRGEALVKLARVGRTKLARNTGPRVV